jgi:hypothetical protein
MNRIDALAPYARSLGGRWASIRTECTSELPVGDGNAGSLASYQTMRSAAGLFPDVAQGGPRSAPNGFSIAAPELSGQLDSLEEFQVSDR